MEYRINLFGVLVAVGVLFSGCAPMAKTSKLMDPAPPGSIPASPPAGKSLVCIHLPQGPLRGLAFNGGSGLFTTIWDGTNFVADLGNEHSVAYVCEPGKHYFMNRSVELLACVEAQLLPDKTYDLWVKSVTGFATPSYKLMPLHQDEKTRKEVAKWTRKHHWVTPGSGASAYEQHKQDVVQQLLLEFTSGKRRDKIQILAADDHR